MDQQTQRQFIAQLAQWAQQACDDGRFPFRKVEIEPQLITEQGALNHQCMVLWINRASCMAGAIIFFPDTIEKIELQAAAAARSLGLNFFVCWTPQSIQIWSADTPSRCLIAETPYSGEQINDFHNQLLTLLDTLKPWSITGQTPPASLSPHYFINLCLITVNKMRPRIQQGVRQSRATNESESAPPDWEAATELKLSLTLLRLLAVILFDELPTEVRPERLEQAIDFALDRLPVPLIQNLRFNETEQPLGNDCLVRLHHLFRRLVQLNFAEERSRCAIVLRLLLSTPLLNQFLNAAFPSKDLVPTAAGVLVNTLPDFENQVRNVLVAASPLLAAEILRRLLEGQPLPAETFTSTLSLPVTLQTEYICGAVFATRTITPPESRRLSTLLRLSWPHQRFSLPNRTPLWAYEFLHLLGIAQQGRRLAIQLPESWLTQEFGAPLWELVRKGSGLNAIRLLPDHSIQLDFDFASSQSTTEVCLASPNDQQMVPWSWLRKAPRSLLLCLLHFPPELRALLTNGLLSYENRNSFSPTVLRGVFLFIHSGLGLYLWDLIGNGRALPKLSSLAAHLQRLEFPLPDEKFLSNLSLLSSDSADEIPSRRVLNREVNLWFGLDVSTILPKTKDTEAGKRRKKRTDSEASLQQSDIIRQVFCDGVPLFPEHYLLHTPSTELQTFTLPGQLEIEGTFFDQVILTTSDGDRLEVTGLETATALQLASYRNISEVSLPQDRGFTEKILAKYLQDLERLRTSLLQETHRLYPEATEATETARAIWKTLLLPPWSKLTS